MLEFDAIKMEASWKKALQEEFSKSYLGRIREFLLAEKAAGKRVYPPGSLIFNAFNSTPFASVKVVIIGQDPYHKPGEAMGLSFSVPQGVRVPPSLRNIFAELARDISGFRIPAHGDLSVWAKQGVFLLNAMLTVEEGKAASHQKIGWQDFTDAAIRRLSDEQHGLVFLLWGNFAKAKKELIDLGRHHVLEAAHPSPLAGGAFNHCRHFSQANQLLISQGKSPINWQL